MSIETSSQNRILVRAAGRLAKQIERALSGAGLSLPQYRLMALLSEGSAAASVLAERLICSRPSVTALVDGLVARGLVERSHDERDRRKVSHVLTDKGIRLLDEAEVAVEDRLSAIAAFLPERDRQRAYAGLTLWMRAMDEALAKVLREQP